MLCVVTPIPAGLDTGGAQFKTSPVMFDRTPANEIVVPRRWWQLMFENVSADAAAPVEMRQMAAAMVATTLCSDVLLPPDSDTVEIGIADSQGNMTAEKAGDCDKAFKLTLICQCHDGIAQEHLKAAGPRAVCGYLMSK